MVHALFTTTEGNFKVRLFDTDVPNTVANFAGLADGTKEFTDPKTGQKTKRPFYDGLIFHRVIDGFMIQGGDPNTKDSLRKEAYGQGGPKDEKGNPIQVKAEFSELPHKRGVVSMARAQDPDTAGSQFFIVVEDSRFLDRKYTIFGEVVKGIGVADKIVGQPRVMCQTGTPNPPDKGPCDNPLERVEMTVNIVE